MRRFPRIPIRSVLSTEVFFYSIKNKTSTLFPEYFFCLMNKHGIIIYGPSSYIHHQYWTGFHVRFDSSVVIVRVWHICNFRIFVLLSNQFSRHCVICCIETEWKPFEHLEHTFIFSGIFKFLQQFEKKQTFDLVHDLFDRFSVSKFKNPKIFVLRWRVFFVGFFKPVCFMKEDMKWNARKWSW